MSITIHIRYCGKGNAALDFAKEMTESGTVEKSVRKEVCLEGWGEDKGTGVKRVVTCRKNAAAEEGFEPSITGPKPAVLPLHHPAVQLGKDSIGQSSGQVLGMHKGDKYTGRVVFFLFWQKADLSILAGWDVSN